MTKTISIAVTGKVQGVWFRKYTQEKAKQLAINGFVKNIPSGSVYIIATGTDEQLQEFINWCWQGSPKSKVTSVQEQELAIQQFKGFRIL